MLKQPNALAEGFIVAGTLLVIAVILVFGAGALQSGGFSVFFSNLDLPVTLGNMTGRFILFTLLMAGFATWRNRSGITKPFYVDWRYYVLGVFAVASPGNGILGWIWCGCIYQFRLSRHIAHSHKSDASSLA